MTSLINDGPADVIMTFIPIRGGGVESTHTDFIMRGNGEGIMFSTVSSQEFRKCYSGHFENKNFSLAAGGGPGGAPAEKIKLVKNDLNIIT